MTERTADRLVLHRRTGAVGRVVLAVAGGLLVAFAAVFLRVAWSTEFLDDGSGGPGPLFQVLFTVPPVLVALGGLAALTAAVVGPEETWTVDADGIAVVRRTMFARNRTVFVDADRARRAYVLVSTSGDGPGPGGSRSYAVAIPAEGRGRALRYATPGGLAAAEATLSQLRAALGPVPGTPG